MLDEDIKCKGKCKFLSCAKYATDTHCIFLNDKPLTQIFHLWSVGVVTIWQNTCLKKPYEYYFLSFLFSFRVPSLWKWNKTEFRWQVLAENIGRCDEIFCRSEKFLESFCQSINLREVTRKMKYIESLEKRLYSIYININKTRICCKLTSHIWRLISCRVVTTKHTQPTNHLPALQDIILVHCQAEGCFCL